MKKEYLRKHLETTYGIIRSAQQRIYDSQRILLLDTDEQDQIIRPNKFMYRAYESFWILAVIGTYMLFGSDNDDYRLQKLINYLRNSYRNSEWKNDITLHEINELAAQLSAPDVVEKTKLLHEARNQHYAHKQKSPNRHWGDIDLYYEGMDYLLKVAETFCDSINRKVFGNEAFNYPVDTDSVNTTINELVDCVRLKGLLSLKDTK